MFKPLYRIVSRGPALLRNRITTATFDENLRVYIFPDDRSLTNNILSLLPSNPPNTGLAIGTTSKLPPSPDSLDENPKFLDILHAVLSEHAYQDPGVVSQAKAMASSSGSNLGSGGAFFPRQQKRRGTKFGHGGMAGDGAGGASSQGGAGGGGRGGYIHVYDERNLPDYGRIASPEDIFGSLEVDSAGNFVDGKGKYQSSGTYRILTREGCLGLSPFLRAKLVHRLRQEA